jgi:uncharacterized ion transporter superfamily protein YfcC
MTAANDTDIQQIKDLIAAGNAATQKQIGDLTLEMRLGFSDLRGELKTIDVRLKNLESNSQKIPDLAEKVGELKNWKQIAIVIFTATVGGAIGWLVRMGKIYRSHCFTHCLC